MKKFFIAAIVAAFGVAVVLPAVAIVGSKGAYAAQSTTGKTAKKKHSKRYHKKTKAAPSQM